MNISVFGIGYVGLVSAACLAEMGNSVVCYDVDLDKLNCLSGGDIPIYEPELKDLVVANIRAGRISFTADVSLATSHGETLFIAVGTPSDEDGSADMSYVLECADNIASNMNSYKLIVNKSTVPVGTLESIRDVVTNRLTSRGLSFEFDVASNPEFLKEGAAIKDFMRPDRIILGVDNERSLAILQEIYFPFLRNHDRIIVMDIRSAELTKYASNAMLATRISFMNELAGFAEVVGADIESVRLGVGSDRRIGLDFLYAGCGYGGSCFPKDVSALSKSASSYNFDMPLLNAVEKVNRHQKNILIRKIKSHFGDDLSGKKFALWGLSFKPGTDDLREAPSKCLVEAGLRLGASFQCYDPVSAEKFKRIYQYEDHVSVFDTKEEACLDADALIIVTEWKEFRSPSFDVIEKLMKAKVIFDGRNMYSLSVMSQKGWSYNSIGRPRIVI